MTTVIHEKQLSAEITEKFLSRRRAMVSRLEEIAKEHDIVLFDGNWLTLDETHLYFRRLRRAHRRIFFELLLLFAGLLIASAFVLLILLDLAGFQLVLS